ncbi:MAG: TonB-dependent receptor [Pseudomonadota bacterium]
MKLRYFLMLSISPSVLLTATPAFSQDTFVSEVVLNEIVITARRKEENLIDSPSATTAVSSKELEETNSQTLEEVLQLAPNVLYNEQGGPISIRGITSPGISGGVDRQPAVGVFLDGVYIARPNGYPMFMDDLERVEIVRGSQSTLYGKNTIGGAINLLTMDPDGTNSGEVVGRIAEKGTIYTQLSYQAALGDKLANRTTLIWETSDGYIDNQSDASTVGDADRIFGRNNFLAELSEDTRIRISLDYGKDNSDGGLWYAPVESALDFKTPQDFDPEFNLETGGVAVRVEHDFDTLSLTSTTAFRGHDYSHYLDGDLSGANYLGQGQTENQRQFSQEFRLTTAEDGIFDWSIGAFYMYEHFDAAQYYDLVSVPKEQWSRSTFDQRTNTFAVYAQADWEFAEMWELSGGVRYTHERKSSESEISSPSGNNFFGASGAADADIAYDDVSPELTLSWRPKDAMLLYGKVSKGFKSGGTSPYIEPDGSANSYDPEQTLSTELGFKYSFEDRFWLSAAAFYTSWQDQQVVIYTNPGFTRVYRNAASSVSRGFELEATLKVTNELQVSGYYGYTDAYYEDFVDETLGEDYSGNPLPYAPRNSLGAVVNWQQELGAGFLLDANVDYSYRSSFSFNPDNEYRQDDVHLLGASLGLSYKDFGARLYAKNITDERYLKNYFDFGGTDVGTAAEGRVVGIEASFTF